jgi:hypothetical protein
MRLNSLVLMMFLFSCGEIPVTKLCAPCSVDVYFTTIDSCEYVVATKYFSDGGVSIVHKENCKYCAARNNKPCK